MNTQNTAEIVSLGLTVPTVVLGIGVCIHWGRSAMAALLLSASERSAIDWLILGIFVGFLGMVLDNSYWGIAWTASYIEHESKDALFNSGVYFNIPFRQLAGLYAAYCHLRSYARHKDLMRSNMRLYGSLSVVLAIAYLASLLLIKE